VTTIYADPVGVLAGGASGRALPPQPRGEPETRPSPVKEAGYAIAVAPIMLAIGGGKPWFFGKYHQGVDGDHGGAQHICRSTVSSHSQAGVYDHQNRILRITGPAIDAGRHQSVLCAIAVVPAEQQECVDEEGKEDHEQGDREDSKPCR